MTFEEPAYLTVGTEVSAKYRGAFCEATVKNVEKVVKCKVILKLTSARVIVLDEAVKGCLQVGCTVEVNVAGVGDGLAATIQKVTDQSMYTVVFDDGDENTLRRSQLCLKGEKHFVKSDTLDELPLTNPEHFGTPVIKSKLHKGRRAGSASDGEDDASDSARTPRPAVGRVVLVEERGRRAPGGGARTPALVIRPGGGGSAAPAVGRDELLVKSFKDNRICAVPKKGCHEFTREMATKNEDKAFKAAFEKALLYVDTRAMPAGWQRDELIGSTDDADDIAESSDGDEPNEERDLFVAQLYKFMDDRGTPINKAPIVAGQDLNLYRLFRLVHKLGGYNRVTNQLKWRLIYSKMNLPPSSAASNQIKTAYKKFLHAFEDFYRKLGSSMGTISRPGARGRHPSASGGRSILSFRDRETPASPRVSSRNEHKEIESRVKSRLSARHDALEPPAASGVARPQPPAEGASESPRPKGVKKDSAGDSPRRTRPCRSLPLKARPDTRGARGGEGKERAAGDDDGKGRQTAGDEEVKGRRVASEEVKGQRAEDVEGTGKKALDEEVKGCRTEDESKGRGMADKEGKGRQTADKEGKGRRAVDEEVKGCRAVDEEGKGHGTADKEGKGRRTEDGEGKRRGSTDEEGEMAAVTRGKAATWKGGEETKCERKPGGKSDDDSSDVEDKEEGTPKVPRRRAKKMTDDDGERDARRPGALRKRVSSEAVKEAGGGGSSGEMTRSPETDDRQERDERKLDTDVIAIGSKLKVKYGRGRDQKMYEAKVVECQREGGLLHYRVHYDGWNKRYDEWVRRDRIVGVVAPASDPAEPPPGKKVKVKSQSSKTVRKTCRSLEVVVGGDAPGGRGRAPNSAPNSVPRPTRSNSVEQSLAAGLPLKMVRSRRSSGLTDTTDTQSHGSESGEEKTNSGDEADDDAGSDVIIDVMTNTSPEKTKLPDAGAGSDDDSDGDGSVESFVQTRVLRSRDDSKAVRTQEDGAKVKSREGSVKTRVTAEEAAMKKEEGEEEASGDVAEAEEAGRGEAEGLAGGAADSAPHGAQEGGAGGAREEERGETMAAADAVAAAGAEKEEGTAGGRPAAEESTGDEAGKGEEGEVAGPARKDEAHFSEDDVQTEVKEVDTEVKDVATEVKDVATEVNDVDTEVKGVDTEVKAIATEVKTEFTEAQQLSASGCQQSPLGSATGVKETVGKSDTDKKDSVKVRRKEGKGRKRQLEDDSVEERRKGKKRQLEQDGNGEEGKGKKKTAAQNEDEEEVKGKKKQAAQDEKEGKGRKRQLQLDGDEEEGKGKKKQAAEDEKDGKGRKRQPQQDGDEEEGMRTKRQAAQAGGEGKGKGKKGQLGQDGDEEEGMRTKRQAAQDGDEGKGKGKKGQLGQDGDEEEGKGKKKQAAQDRDEKEGRGKKRQDGDEEEGKEKKREAAQDGDGDDKKGKNSQAAQDMDEKEGRGKKGQLGKEGDEEEGKKNRQAEQEEDQKEGKGKKRQLGLCGDEEKVKGKKNQSAEDVDEDEGNGKKRQPEEDGAESDRKVPEKALGRAGTEEEEGKRCVAGGEGSSSADGGGGDAGARQRVGRRARTEEGEATRESRGKARVKGKACRRRKAAADGEKAREDGALQHFVNTILSHTSLEGGQTPAAAAARRDTPPPTPPRRPLAPTHDDPCCTASEHEANLEVACLMGRAGGLGPADSPLAAASTLSGGGGGGGGGSSGTAPSSEDEPLVAPGGGAAALVALAAAADSDAKKRSKRGHKLRQRRASEDGTRRLTTATTATDSDEADCKSEVAPSIPKLSSADKDVAAICTEASQPGAHVGRPSKFNFTESLEEGKYLEGDSRIEFLVGKIQQMRNIYMQLKAEVACIDRRRRRHDRRLDRPPAITATTPQTNASPDAPVVDEP